MTKLTELEKQKVIACVCYVEEKFRCDRYKLEVGYNKMGFYNEELEKKICYMQEMEEFYSALARKLQEVL